MCIKKILSVSLILSLFLLSSLAIAGQKGPVAAQNAKILAYATEAGAETQDKGVTLWRNEFQSTAGIVSATLLANDDTLGGKSCILADDFTVPAGEIWTLDTIRVYMFWYKKATDSIRITLYPDAGGFPDEYSVLNTFSVKVTMPAALTLYTININVVAQNIVLPEATYWLSAVGIHNTGTMAVDTCLTLWNRKDTLLGTYTAQCMDSIGAHYTPYPTPSMGLG